MILDIYKDSFEFASKKISSLLLLGTLSFFSLLIIPIVFVYGYNYRVIKLSTQSMINGGDVPPDFDDFKTMFIDGLKYILVTIAYLFVPIIVISLAMSYKSLIIGIVGIILFIICALFAFIAVPHMAINNDSLKSAFSIGELNEIVSSIGFGRYILTYIGIVLIAVVIFAVVLIILSIIFGVLGIAMSFSSTGVGAVGIVGTIIMNFVLFFIVTPYLSLFKNRCAGLIYSLGS